MNNDPDLVDYLQEISHFPLLTPEEERAVAERVANGDEGARRTLILSNLRLVVSIAKQFTHSEFSFLDLITEGNYGLIRAADHYRTDKEARFATYAAYWIKQAIAQSLKVTSRQIHIPDQVLRVVKMWQKAAARLEQELQRVPTSVEISAAINLPVSRVPAILKVISALKNISQDYILDDASQIDETAVASARQPGGPVKTHEMFDFDAADQRKFTILLQCLTPREAAVLRHRYGIDGTNKLTLEETGAQMPGKPLTRERVRQIEIEALRKIIAILQPRP